MNFDLSDDQKMLEDQARRYLAGRVSFDALRRAIDSGHTFDRELWREIAELGWTAVAIPEEHGGLGLGVIEQCVVAAELGRCVAPVPYVSSLGLAATAILHAGSDEQKARWLPALASGETIAALAYAEGPGEPGSATEAAFAVSAADGILSGTKWPVLDAAEADLLVVAVAGAAGPELHLVEAASQGITREPILGFDLLRSGAAVTFAGVASERLPGDASLACARAFEVAAVLTAFEQVGGAEACLAMSRDWALERRAFGRPIGSFQAIKHKLADMLTHIELARSNAYYAAWALANGAPDSSLAVAAARLSATHAYEFAARENNQVHGGISFTWEANCHFHYRRSRLLTVAYGSPRHWSRQIVDRLVAAQEG